MADAELRLVVPESAVGGRLDTWLAAQDSAPTRSQIKRAVREGRLSVDGAAGRLSLRLRGGEVVELSAGQGKQMSGDVVAQDIPLTILFEDEHIVAVDKAHGMVVHPAVGNPDGTLVNAVLGRYGPAGLPGESHRVGIVHRLDRDTSGVILVARTVEAHEALSRQFRERTISKTYLALVRGNVAEAGQVDAPIGRHPRDRKKMSTAATVSRAAVTDYTPLERFGAATWLEARPLTGRTHQIRVHLASRGWPIVGDPIYGSRPRASRTGGGRVIAAVGAVPRLALHAAAIEFDHPSGERLKIEAPLPADLAVAIQTLREVVSNVVDSR
ncbi:MAG: 23S rRNA pseudouridine1911/1915/1917 synthase [Hyphomicrobiaceae bacterium]